jgi:hypothetical protein
MMSLQTCVNRSCSSQSFHSKPEGHDIQYPWLVSFVCNHCNTHWFICNGLCIQRGNRTRRNSRFYSNMKQVRRHHLQCHVRQLPAQHTSPEFFLTPRVSDPLENTSVEYDDASVGMEKDDVGSEYYELKDGSQPTLDLDGIISCDSGVVDVVDESIEGRVQDSTGRENIFSIPELPSRDGNELVPADDVDLHYLPLWSTMDAPESISGKFKRNFVNMQVVLFVFRQLLHGL